MEPTVQNTRSHHQEGKCIECGEHVTVTYHYGEDAHTSYTPCACTRGQRGERIKNHVEFLRHRGA